MLLHPGGRINREKRRGVRNFRFVGKPEVMVRPGLLE
jgi:hypothetical protein